MITLGISAYYHDSAIAIVEDDHILFAIQEERLSRKKGDERFPRLSIIQGIEFLGATRGGGNSRECLR